MALNGDDERDVLRSNAPGDAGTAHAPPAAHPTEAELAAAREALQARERELSLIYANVSDVIFYIAIEPGGRYRFVSVNQAFLTATGLSERITVPVRSLSTRQSLSVRPAALHSSWAPAGPEASWRTSYLERVNVRVSPLASAGTAGE